MKKYIINSFIGFLKKNKRKIFPRETLKAIYNIGYNPILSSQKRVLFSYDISALVVHNSKWISLGNTHSQEFICIINCLVKKGFIIDAIDFANPPKCVDSNYNVVIGLGETWRLASKQNPQAIKILYLTENTPDFSYKREKERIEYLKERHGISFPIQRSGKFFQKEDFEKINGIMCMCGEYIRQDLPKIPIWFFSPTGLYNSNFSISSDLQLRSVKHYIWFGSTGIIHKGLDILLDAFSRHQDLILHVCGCKKSDIHKIRNLIPPNFIFHGFVKVDTDDFLSLMRKCSFVILPSCSEAMATSVLTCMNHGLIPIVTKEIFINFIGVVGGEILEDYRVETVEKVIVKWSNKEDTFIRMQMNNIYEYMHSFHNINKFSNRIDHIFSEMCKIYNLK